ncbi:MAG: WecB/TagA/CpsF family glycosyltransferase [Chloroflexi bacterium]|nr:WecB/TagA/CpsF family glycosyltransferase [Chloroflexota bacterium]
MKKMLEKINILKLDINRNKLDEIVESSISLARKGIKHYICVPNAYLTVIANNDNEVLNIINKADFVIPDGMPLVWYSKTFKKSIPSRISGYDFFYQYCKKMDENKMSCFLFGGESEDVARRIIKRINEDFENIEIVGYFIPPFIEEFKGAIKEKIQIVINRKKPDVVWVGLSAPKQEKWIYDNIRRLDAKMVCGIGAVFNFYSGRVKRAPKWMQKIGLEWLFRIFAEPRRLFKKYIVYNTKFIILVFKDIFRRIFKFRSLKGDMK